MAADPALLDRTVEEFRRTLTEGVVKKLNEVFGEAGLDSWTLAAFATAPQPELGNRAPVDSFADADIEPLLLSAHRTVADLKSAPMAGSTSLSQAPATSPRSQLAPSSRSSGACCGQAG